MGTLLTPAEEKNLFSLYRNELVLGAWRTICSCDVLWARFSPLVASRSRKQPRRQIKKDPGGHRRFAIQQEFDRCYPDELDCPDGCCLALARQFCQLARLREELVRRNVGLACQVALRRKQFGAKVGMEQEDLIQWAYIGLCESIERFDPEFGTRFSTYAVWWISHYVSRAIANDGLVRIPVHLQKRGKPGWDLKQPPLSLDTPMNEELGVASFANEIPDESWAHPRELLEARHSALEVRQAIGTLCLRDRQIILMRYGLAPFTRSHTLEEVGRKFSLTRERIRQLEVKVLIRLRARLLKAS